MVMVAQSTMNPELTGPQKSFSGGTGIPKCATMCITGEGQGQYGVGDIRNRLSPDTTSQYKGHPK